MSYPESITKRISKQNFNVAFLIPQESLKLEWLIGFTRAPLPRSFTQTIFVCIHTDLEAAIDSARQGVLHNLIVVDYKNKIYNTCIKIETEFRHIIYNTDIQSQYYILDFLKSPYTRLKLLDIPAVSPVYFIEHIIPICYMIGNEHRIPETRGKKDLTADKFIKDILQEMQGVSTKECYADNCHNTEGLLKCSRCKIVKYCCRTCQRNDWSQHKKVCKSITDLVNSRTIHDQSYSKD